MRKTFCRWPCFQRELVTNAGAVIPVVVRGEPQRDGEGKVVGIRAMYVDITERKRQRHNSV